MNVFHWHITDDQSFPFALTSCPKLSEGTYRQFKCIYSEEDVEKLLHYARQRGIRVIAEFDTPGSPTQILRVIGGEAKLWSTHVDETNVTSLAWYFNCESKCCLRRKITKCFVNDIHSESEHRFPLT
ncbi:unnamed protein product [Trichobilharzia regenti]|nr:unnamed protein product [Trichobilharzia regenti]